MGMSSVQKGNTPPCHPSDASVRGGNRYVCLTGKLLFTMDPDNFHENKLHAKKTHRLSQACLAGALLGVQCPAAAA